MRYIALALALLCAGPLFARPVSAQAAPAPVTAMTPTPDDRAKQWLTLIDDGNYAESWNQAGPYLKGKISAEAFGHQVGSARMPLGAMSSRNLKDVKISKALRGMPDGQYAVVRYDSAFAHKASAVESVTLSSGKDGWSVIGYHID